MHEFKSIAKNNVCFFFFMMLIKQKDLKSDN